MKKFFFLAAVVLGLSFSIVAPQTTSAQTTSCLTDDKKEGQRTGNGPCLPVVPVTRECNPATESCISDECQDPTNSSVECQQQKQAPARTGVDSGFKALVPIPGLTGNSDGSSLSVVDSDSLADFFNNLYLYAIGLAAVAAIIQIMRAGFMIAFNPGNVSMASEVRGRIASTLLGLVLVLSPVVVFSLINPAILNLELQLPPLDTKAVVPQTGPYPDGASCKQASDCQSNVCDRPAIGDSGVCGRYARGKQCTANYQCASNECDTSTSPGVCRDRSVEDKLILDGGACTTNLECVSTVCDPEKKTCAAKGDFPTDALCTRDDQCRSRECSLHGDGRYRCNAP